MARVTRRYPVEGVHAKLVVVAGAILRVDVRSAQQTINSKFNTGLEGIYVQRIKKRRLSMNADNI